MMKRTLLPPLAALLLLAVCRLDAADCDVRDFGAVGDGAAVNTAAIQKAIDACRDGGRGRVVLTPRARSTLDRRSASARSQKVSATPPSSPSPAPTR
jgi:hypothetical protein